MGLRRNDWGILILTHGRPNTIRTLGALKRNGYTGPIKFVIDDEDKKADEYRANYGDDVIMFSKEEVAKTFDESDNFSDRRTITYARNAAYDIAKELGWRYFIQMDDDYTSFVWKFRPDLTWKQEQIRNLDAVLESLVDFMDSTPAHSIALSQGGDFIGGPASTNAKSINISIGFKRKTMNSFVCAVDRRVNFVSRMNEDVSTYTWRGSTGHLFFSTNFAMLTQSETQGTPGGITELYQKYGTYVKSFYTVMRMPSSVRISAMVSVHPRIHHSIKWKNTVPAILGERWRKRSGV